MAFILRGGNQIRPLKKEQTEEIISPWRKSLYWSNTFRRWVAAVPLIFSLRVAQRRKYLLG